ncbi:MAG: TonB-dependent receptor [Prevotella sp.]|jgi:TonB-linked SusC/RagA family outer membrane protein|uniref:TonB-dependent receptor plug domain-containing protein n=2 Tax=Dysgonomonas TaxID=156973 RepID=F5IT65_9BACT|nr:TonB-dependent receptor [Dysgonomonas gadei]EGJ99249.1 hypothetical protein HMPREF9455_00282 [Dysgonomonas gadei ATCC BAA-286]MDR1717748.1 TonB-dependent receptor [Prevotella sp.]
MKINYDEKRKRRYPKFIWILLCAFMCLSNAYSQKTITGKVTDSHQEALAGVSVVLKGATVGTFTDIDGAYKITVPSGDASLEFSFLGFKPQTVIVGNRSEINITLVENLKELDEVVVVGYGVQKRAHLTGSVSQITSEDIVKAPMQNVSNMLTGKLPGLTSLQRSGKPGDDGATFYVRGLNSFAGGNGPMIVVDGVPRTIDNLNPNDIESVSVLKDAAASVYGIQGANGVILITTKSGSEGPAKIFYDGSMTWTANTAMPEYLNARDYMYWHNKARQMDGLDPLWTAGIQNKVMSDDPNSIFGQTDWLDKIFRTGITQQHNISASGATERVKYYASIGFMNQEGTLINTDLKRYNVRTNLDIQVAKNLKFSIGLSGDRRDRHWPGTAIGNQTEFSPIRQAIAAIPIFKSEYDGMNVAWNNGTYNNNGYAALTESGWKNNTQWQLNSNYKLEYDLSGLTDVLKGLKASVFAAYNYSNTTDDNYDRYYEVYSINGNFDQGVSGASGYTKGNSYSKSASWGDTWMLRPQFDYSREFGKHSISATLLFETKKSYSNTMTGAARGFYSDVAVDISMGLLSLPKGWQAVTGSHKYSDGTASYVGRLNYVFDKKYLAEVVVRRDGSYVFAPENRWGTFPMASAGWVVSEEEFFSNAFPNVDFFKIRASVGTAGNMVNNMPYLYQSEFEVAKNSMVLGDNPITQLYTKNAYLYRDVTWASTILYNLGFDYTMWKGKLGVELDLFYKRTYDIIQTQSGAYPPSLGGLFPAIRNSGEVENKGFELTLKHDNRIDRDWSYGLKGNFSFARNRVLKIINPDDHPLYRSQLGQSMNARYGFKALGLFQSQEEIDNYPIAPSGNLRPGDIKYEDVNGDGIISSMYDYVKIGYGDVPEITFSLDMNLSYKNFYATLLWQGVTNTDYTLSGTYDTGVLSSTNYTASFAENGNSPYYRIEGAWTPENPNAKYPRLTTVNSGNNAWHSTWWLVNGEYLRLKNANIGYNVPSKVLKSTPFSSVNIYLAGTNLLTFSHFKYVDPESPSVSNGYYPQQKTYSLGLKVTF